MALVDDANIFAAVDWSRKSFGRHVSLLQIEFLDHFISFLVPNSYSFLSAFVTLRGVIERHFIKKEKSSLSLRLEAVCLLYQKP